ncbi:MAG: hypothetical protein K2I76_04190, partial [Malacoplasma sp.]|nr:hypothetical protein [Malacoplasma sp.]
MIIWLLIVSLVFFGVSVFFASAVIFIYLKKQKCKRKENFLKKQINELLEYNFEKINIPIE